MNALLVGYDLIDFINGTITCPATSYSDFNYWRRQAQLTLHAIISSVDPQVVTMLGNMQTSKQAWDILTRLFASKIRHRILYLKERLSRSFKGSKTMTEYLHGVKCIFDELVVIGCQVDDDYLVIHTLNGLSLDYK